MSPHKILLIGITSILLIFGMQIIVVHDYYQTTKASLIRETDAILQDGFRKELSFRHKIYKHQIGEDTITAPPPPTRQNMTRINCSDNKSYNSNITAMYDLIVNALVSRLVPQNISRLDSFINEGLHQRQISSEFCVQVIDTKSGKVLAQSQEMNQFKLFNISSQSLNISVSNDRALKLCLFNPFELIFRRMAIMLISSLLLAILCLIAFRYLVIILNRQKQLVAFKNDFLSTIAHELKRPVAALSVNLDAMTLPGIFTNPAHYQPIVNRSARATAEMNDTITMIVALSKAEEGLLKLNKRNVVLNDMLTDIQNRFSETIQKPVSIHLHIQSEYLTISADEQLLQQCFANLVDNAIKYSGEAVDIDIRVMELDDKVQIAISDNGIGIPADKLPAIFGKFNRAHESLSGVKGYGIGLNYVKTVIEKHQGTIGVKSTTEQGSTFIVELPYS